MINKLPHWCLTDIHPAFNDTESLSVLEQTSRLYGKVQELIESYNNFATDVNNKISEYENNIDKDQEKFEEEINELIHEYIIALDLKIDHQDRVIEENITYIKENLATEVERVVNEMKESGQLDESILNNFDNISSRVVALENTEYTLVYEEGTENLILQKIVKEGE